LVAFSDQSVFQTPYLEIAAAFRVAAIAINLYGAARSFAGGATVFLSIRNRTATRRILAGLSLFLVSHNLSLHFFPA
jgi:hypothetical protein